MLRDNLVGLIEPMPISAGVDPLALSIQKQASDDRSSCLENPRPEGAESSLTENVASPFQAEPAQPKKTSEDSHLLAAVAVQLRRDKFVPGSLPTHWTVTCKFVGGLGRTTATEPASSYAPMDGELGRGWPVISTATVEETALVPAPIRGLPTCSEKFAVEALNVGLINRGSTLSECDPLFTSVGQPCEPKFQQSL